MHSGHGYSRKVTKTMKTKKIRIAVAMNEDGSEWSAQGWDGGEDEEMLNSCDECLKTAPRVRRFIEVEVPLPAEQPILQGHLIENPEVVEVANEADFQEGDLISWKELAVCTDRSWHSIDSIHKGMARYSTSQTFGMPLEKLEHKPIEVGDTVRVKGLGRGKVTGRESTTMHPPRWCVWLDCEKPGTYVCPPNDCIAVAP